MSRLVKDIKILYEDNHLLGVFKPAGMLVQGDKTGDLSLLDWSKAWIKKKYEKPGRVFMGLVHRLDRPVPGVVIFARTSKAAGRLSSQFRDHTVVKTYWGVVHGSPRPSKGSSKVYLKKKGNSSTLSSPSDPLAKYAELTYKTIGKEKDFSFLEIGLITGRRHQIRAQFSAMGHPILGDRRYGPPFPSASIGLLAKAITFRHPTKPMDITIDSPVPGNWPWPPPTV